MLTKPRRQRIVFINRFYKPDIAATAQMLTDLAEQLNARGWAVAVITARTSYTGAPLDVPRFETVNGVDVYRVMSTAFGRGSSFSRVVDYVTFLLAAFWTLLTQPKFDAAIALTDPPFLLLPVLTAARLRNARAVLWAQDVYPALAAKLGVLEPAGATYRMLQGLATALHRNCDLVVSLGEQMRLELLRQGAAPAKTVVIPNWADEQQIQPIPPQRNNFLIKKGWTGKFVVLYSGNAGRGHTFASTCAVMEQLKNDPNIVFVFIGGGEKSRELRQFVHEREIKNAAFLDYQPRSELTFSLSAGSASLITEDPAVVGLLVPSKTYGILASGRPIIFVGSEESDVAKTVRATRSGTVVSPHDVQALYETIQNWRSDPAKVALMGTSGREASEGAYSLQARVDQWSNALRLCLQST